MRATFWPGWQRTESWAAASIFPGWAAARSIRICETPAIQRSLRRIWTRRPGALSRTAQRTADDYGEPRGLSRYSGQESPGQRIALLDHYGAAQAHRLSGHHLLRRYGDGRHSEIHAHRRGCGCGHPRGNGSAGNLPQPGADSARLRSSDCRGRAVGGLPQAAAERAQADRAATRETVCGRRSGSADGASNSRRCAARIRASAEIIRNAQPDPQEAQPA